MVLTSRAIAPAVRLRNSVTGSRTCSRGAMFGAVAKLQLIEQSLSLFQIERVKAFGEPAVDRSEKIASLITLA